MKKKFYERTEWQNNTINASMGNFSFLRTQTVFTPFWKQSSRLAEDVS